MSIKIERYTVEVWIEGEEVDASKIPYVEWCKYSDVEKLMLSNAMLKKENAKLSKKLESLANEVDQFRGTGAGLAVAEAREEEHENVNLNLNY